MHDELLKVIASRSYVQERNDLEHTNRVLFYKRKRNTLVKNHNLIGALMYSLKIKELEKSYAK